MWHKILFLITLLAGLSLVLVARDAGCGPAGNSGVTLSAPVTYEKTRHVPAAVSVTPEQVDLGIIGPGQTAGGKFALRSISPRPLQWSTRGPAGWTAIEQQELRAVMEGRAAEPTLKLRVSARMDASSRTYPVRMSLEAGAQSMICVKDLPPGIHHEAVPLIIPGGTINVPVNFKIIGSESEPVLAVESWRIDLGKIVEGHKANRIIKVTNRGRNALKWRIDSGNGEKGTGRTEEHGRYVSFFNDTVAEHETYALAAHLRQSIGLRGTLSVNAGYPRIVVGSGVIRCRFSGTGISVLFWRGPQAGIICASVDDAVQVSEAGRSPYDEESEILVAEDLPSGDHMLTITARDADVVLEGVRIYGMPVVKGKSGIITFSPNSGVTTRETDYVKVTVNSQLIKPGIYAERFLVTSNGGDELIEISFEVAEDHVIQLLDVFRYARGFDHVYTTMPHAEASALTARDYVKQGIAFRLFSVGTPGTTEFYRWYNPERGDHYYSYGIASAGSLKGYRFEGSEHRHFETDRNTAPLSLAEHSDRSKLLFHGR